MFHREYNWFKHSIQMFWHTHRHRQIDIIYVLVCVYLDVLRHLLLFDKFHRTIECAENAGGEPKRRFTIDLNWYDLNMFLVSWNRDKTERCEYSQIPIKIVCSVCEQWLLCACGSFGILVFVPVPFVYFVVAAAEHMINEKHIKSKSVIWFVAAGACSFLSICIKFHHWTFMFTSETQHLHRWQRCHRCYWSLITIDLCTHTNKPLCCKWFKHLLSALHGLFTVSSVWCWRAHAILRKAMNTFGIRN